MLRKTLLVAGCVAVGLALTPPIKAQATARIGQVTPHLIIIKLVEVPGSAVPFAFEPAKFTAERGDTLQFVQLANTMHDVHFKTQPKGAKLGGAAVSPYLTTKGEKYKVVVDSRFVDGTYEIVCDPHEMIGMHAVLTVTGNASTDTAKAK